MIQWGKLKENGIWLAKRPEYKLMFWGHDSLYIAGHRLRFRLMKPLGPRKLLNAIKRFWVWFICEHTNSTVILGFSDSTELRICQRCGRVISVMDDNDRRHNQHKATRLSL